MTFIQVFFRVLDTCIAPMEYVGERGTAKTLKMDHSDANDAVAVAAACKHSLARKRARSRG